MECDELMDQVPVIIAISSILSLIAMMLALIVQWKLEKETNARKPFFGFHIFNVLSMFMFYGTSYLALTLSFSSFAAEGGIARLLLKITLFPFPFILMIYVICAYFYRTYVRPYYKEGSSNVIYLRYGRSRWPYRRG